MPEHAGVVRVTTFATDDTHRGRLIQALNRISEELRSVDGCFGSQVCSVDERPAAVAAVSRWRSNSDLDGHLSRRGESIAEAVGGLLVEAPQAVHFTSLE